MPSAAFTTAADDSKKLLAKPSNEELLEVSEIECRPSPNWYFVVLESQPANGVATAGTERASASSRRATPISVGDTSPPFHSPRRSAIVHLAVWPAFAVI